jgi:putative DNA primase/helicase
MLVGNTSLQKAFFLYGTGSNGKGTFIGTIQAVLGRQYSTTISIALAQRANRGSANAPAPALMKLINARVAFCNEWPQGEKLDEGFFKQVTGNDHLTGRGNYEDQIEFRTAAKLTFSLNHLPEMPAQDSAHWRRVLVLPFTKEFREGETRNNTLEAELREEASGILNLMIRGAKLFLKSGQLPLCREVEEATEKARARSDTVGAWVDAECRKRKAFSIGASDAWDAYSVYVRRENVKGVTQKVFSSKLQAMNFQRSRQGKGYVYHGLKLINS